MNISGLIPLSATHNPRVNHVVIPLSGDYEMVHVLQDMASLRKHTALVRHAHNMQGRVMVYGHSVMSVVNILTELSHIIVVAF